MTSKALKPRTRGRKCKANVARTETGRISRAANQGEAPDKLAKETRMRMFGVAEKDAAQPAAGTVIGRLWLSGEISRQQYEALTRYDAARLRNMGAIQAPDSLKTKRGGTMYIPDDEADEKAVAKWKALNRAIMDLQCEVPNRNFNAALSSFICRDEFIPHMLGDLRLVANRLVRFFGIAEDREAV